MGNYIDEPKVGDVVRWRAGSGFGGYLHGVLSRVAATSVTARPERGARPVVLRRRHTGVRWPFVVETPTETALRHWQDAKPFAHGVRASWFAHEARLRLDVAAVADESQIGTLIEELEALREWLSKRPQEPR